MDPVKNPFAPGAGTRPPELAGRIKIMEQSEIALNRVALGRPERSLILVGLRGVGKTVLLNEIAIQSEEIGHLTIILESHEGKSLPELLFPSFRTILFKLSKVEHAKELANKSIRVLKSFIGAFKIHFNEIDVDISVGAETGTADSGDLEADLPELLVAIGKTAKQAGKSIVLCIDELQYLKPTEFSALIMGIHKINQLNLPILFIGAGLPQILGLAGNSKSYAERLFRFPEIGALAVEDARLALTNPATQSGAHFQVAAVDALLDVTKRFPYFIQQWAYEAWNQAEGDTITVDDVLKATPLAIEELDQSFFKVRFDRCTPSEKRYMRALATFGEGNHRSGEVAEKLGVKSQTVAPTRSALIKKGMIYSPSHGDTAFTVPMFHDYMLRVMPEAESAG